MSESIKNLVQGMSDKREAVLIQRLLEAPRVDLVALQAELTTLLADVTAIRASFLLLTAKLDLDAGVTDANYATATNPAALTTTAVAAVTLQK